MYSSRYRQLYIIYNKQPDYNTLLGDNRLFMMTHMRSVQGILTYMRQHVSRVYNGMQEDRCLCMSISYIIVQYGYIYGFKFQSYGCIVEECTIFANESISSSYVFTHFIAATMNWHILL